MSNGPRAKLPPRSDARRIKEREHSQTGVGILIAIDPRDREKMRDLPQDNNQKQQRRPAVELAPDAGPTHQWRHRTRNRADQRVERCPPLERCIDQDVEDQSNRAERRGERLMCC